MLYICYLDASWIGVRLLVRDDRTSSWWRWCLLQRWIVRTVGSSTPVCRYESVSTQ